MTNKLSASLALAATLFCSHVLAQNVEIKDAWARAPVQSQKATGAFMTLTAKTDTTLVGVASSVAGVAEIHEMKMAGDVMQMRQLTEGLAIPAGQSVALKPGSYHLMLIAPQSAIAEGQKVAITLVFEKAGKRTLEFTAAKQPPVTDAGAVHKH